MSVKKVAAILPAYNCAATVGDVLDSVLSENQEELEFVVVDDASTDNTRAVCEKPSVTVFTQAENRGPAVCRNLGIQMTQAPILLFLDSDIEWDAGLLPAMLQCLEDNPHLAGVSTLTSPEPLNPSFASRYFALQEYLRFTDLIDQGMNDWSFISTRCGLLRREVFEETGGFNESLSLAAYEDLEFSSRMDNRHRIALNKSFVVRHYWPDSVWKILKRLHINAQGVIQLPPSMRKKASEPFFRDRNARFFLGLSALLALGGFVWPQLWIAAGIAHLAALWQAKWLVRGCMKHEGTVFTLKAWVVYNLTLLPFATGVGLGMFTSLQKKITGFLHHGRS